MNKPLVSVIIPCFNTWKYIDQAINSIVNQTYEHIELIVVDDGSNQKTKDVLNTLSVKIDVLIHQKNKGQSSARNEGVKNAKGDYILFLDSDDFFEPEFCELAVGRIKNNNEIKIVTCISNIIINNKTSSVFIPKGGALQNMILSNCAMGSCLIRKDDWQITGGYDESMRSGFEDWEFYIRILSLGGKVEVIDKVLFNYRKGHVSTTTKANAIKNELRYYIYTKHKEIFKFYFKQFVKQLLDENQAISNTLRKRENSKEFKIGKIVLYPFRIIKKALSFNM
jgi:glycosyltransferase involved in cell wall biosynthesis